ncbi:pyridoxal phosphate-dependent aminotransferase [Serinibacter salmoneus]|uniref:Aminotransferase n=1 Tax=Serinibacter salmoneus TaxID=556530 RepID=A0A2A9CXQ2_9MICO|nr:aminotransferase class I/II-fold pyridoxal phosphate-dependent enzyme [Serinibacter salmoneus]PFG19218.1 aspartate aminotransferase [Serinibacter salmoneus]
MPSLAHHIPHVPPSGIRRVFEIALRTPDAAYLAVGEPDQQPQPHVTEAARAAWAAGDVRYTPNNGIPELREAVAALATRKRGHDVAAEQVTVTNGGTQALHMAMTMILAPGDEILIPDPGYTTFTMAPRMMNAVPVGYSLRPEHEFVPDAREIAGLVTTRTRAILVNSPSNPLGSVLPRGVLQEIVDLAVEHDLWIISDEVYEELTYGVEHVPLASLPGAAERTLSVHSVSKTYALTGARVGYLITPPGHGVRLAHLQEAVVSCLTTPSQRAALAAITGPQDAVAAAREHYAANLGYITGCLEQIGVPYLRPRGAFYLWIDVRERCGGDVATWAEKLLLDTGVAVAPGSAFGRSGEGWIRICVAASRRSMDRLVAALA